MLVGAIACCWRPWLQHRRHGTWGVFLFRSGSRRQLFRDAMLVLLYVLLLAQAVFAAAGRPESGSFWLQTTGAACMFAGIGLLVLSQLHLGASWRIGIDESAAPGLVTAGLYRYSRNPIYVALVVIVAGYTLLLPTPLSLALLAGTLLGVWQQVRAEEAYLLGTYGESYREYARRVGRFVPGIGKLRQ